MKDYKDKTNQKNIERTREILKHLPGICSVFINAIEMSTSPYTRFQYAHSLKVFFTFLVQEKQPSDEVKAISVKDLSRITTQDIEEYMHWLSLYVIDGETVMNGNNGKAVKLSALSAFYTYLCKNNYVAVNPVSNVTRPKIPSKNIITLAPDEVARLLDGAENDNENKWLNKTGKRNIAILTLLLGTGIRVSECVGLNINDVNFDEGCISIIRKGGNEDRVYFGIEVEEALTDYILNERNNYVTDTTTALFLSIQKKRMSVRSMQHMIKNVTQNYLQRNDITPHKLRATYGTELYEQSGGDIYLVAEVLGHKDINTTKEHYATMSKMRKRSAANYIKLREKEK